MAEEPKWEVVDEDARRKRPAKRTARVAGLGLLVVVGIALILLFQPALAFVEMAARQLRYLWWLALLLALGIWLIVAARKSKG